MYNQGQSSGVDLNIRVAYQNKSGNLIVQEKVIEPIYLSDNIISISYTWITESLM